PAAQLAAAAQRDDRGCGRFGALSAERPVIERDWRGALCGFWLPHRFDADAGGAEARQHKFRRGLKSSLFACGSVTASLKLRPLAETVFKGIWCSVLPARGISCRTRRHRFEAPS